MTRQKTLILIKPDAMARNLAGRIIARFEENALSLEAARLVRLNPDDARAFYAVHRSRDFFEPLCEYMCTGPILALVFSGEDAIARARRIMGATDPAKAEAGTIRREWAETTRRNCVHGSDSPESAAREIGFFFSLRELGAATA